MRRFAKPLYGLTPVPRVRIPPSPPDFFNPNHLRQISFLLDRPVGSLFLTFWCPAGVLNRGDGCRDVVFQLFHRVLHVISGGFDVVRCHRADIRVSKNALDHHLRHTQPIEIATESTAGPWRRTHGAFSLAPVAL